jgi:hypothetical protein
VIRIEREPRQLIVAAVLMMAMAVLQTIAAIMLQRCVWLWRERTGESISLSRLMPFVCGVILYLFALHVVEISIWAAFYLRFTDYPTFAVAFYESALAFTTLDTPELPPTWKFLGTAEAIAGLLMFAWSTAMIFNHTAWITEARRKYLLRGGARPN